MNDKKLDTDLMIKSVKMLADELLKGKITIIQALEYAYIDGHKGTNTESIEIKGKI